MKKRLVSILLMLCMVLTLFPGAAFAASNDVECSSFAQVVQAVGDAVNTDGTVHVYYTGAGDLQITQNLAIPRNVRLYHQEGNITVASGVLVENEGMLYTQKFTVASGASVHNDRVIYVDNGITVNGALTNWDRLILDGGALTVTGTVVNRDRIYMQHGSFTGDELVGGSNINHVDDGCMMWEYDAATGAELKTALSLIAASSKVNAKYGIYIVADVTAVSNVALDEYTYLWVQDGHSLTIPGSYTLTNQGEIFTKGQLTVQGVLDNHQGAQLAINGMEDAGPTGHLTLASGAVYRGLGELIVSADADTIASPDELMTGFDLDEFDVEHEVDSYDGSDWWYLTLKRSVADPGDPAPTRLSGAEQDDGVALSWDAVDGVERYAVYRSEDGENYTWLAGTYTNSYLDTSAEKGKTYFYKVRCYRTAGGVGAYSDVVSVDYGVEAKGYKLTYIYDDSKCDFTGYDWYDDSEQSIPSGGTLYINQEKNRAYGVFEITNIAEGYRIKDFLVNGDSHESSMIDGSYGGLAMTIREDSVMEVVLEPVPEVLPKIESATIRTGSAEGTNSVVVTDVDFGGDLSVLYAKASFEDGEEYPTYYANFAWEYSTDNGASWSEVPAWGTRYDFNAAWYGFTNPEWVSVPVDFMTLENYFLRVRISSKKYYSTVGDAEYAYSAPVSVNFEGTPPDISGAAEPVPENLVYSASAAGVTVNWDAVEGVSRYAVYRSDNGGAYKLVGQINSTSYTDTTVRSGSKYSYKVACCDPDSGDVGPKSTETAVVSYVINAPKSTKLSIAAGRSSVTVSWSAVEGAVRYAVYRSVNGGDFEWKAGVVGTSYTDTDVADGNTYSYKVACYNPGGSGVGMLTSSASSAILHNPALAVPAKPYKIANVVSGVHVYWKATEGADKYGLWRSETGKDGTYKWLANPTVPHFTDTKVESGKTYFYKVTSMDADSGIHSEKSEAIGLKFLSTPDITSRVNYNSGVKLGWQAIEGADGYAIYRKSYEGTDAWVRVATIDGADVLEWIDTSVKNNNGTVYKYTIRAEYGSTLSGCRSAGRTVARVTAPTLNSAVKASANSIKSSWSKNAMADGYEIRFVSGGKVIQSQVLDGVNTVVKTINGLTAGKTYSVQVRSRITVAGVGSFYSAWSNARSVTL